MTDLAQASHGTATLKVLLVMGSSLVMAGTLGIGIKTLGTGDLQTASLAIGVAGIMAVVFLFAYQALRRSPSTKWRHLFDGFPKRQWTRGSRPGWLAISSALVLTSMYLWGGIVAINMGQPIAGALLILIAITPASLCIWAWLKCPKAVESEK